MKRKKPPVALISVLVLALLGLVIVGKSFSFFNLSMEDQQAQIMKEAEERMRATPPPVASNTEKKPDSAAVEAMKKELKRTKVPQLVQAANASEDEHRNFKTAVPTVVMPDDAEHKPTPNTAAPEGQWYNKK